MSFKHRTEDKFSLSTNSPLSCLQTPLNSMTKQFTRISFSLSLSLYTTPYVLHHLSYTNHVFSISIVCHQPLSANTRKAKTRFFTQCSRRENSLASIYHNGKSVRDYTAGPLPANASHFDSERMDGR